MDEPTTTDRLGLEVLDAEECWRLIGSVPVGRVAFVDARGPAALPISHGVLDRTIVFRSAAGTKLGVIERGRPVAFEADHYDDATHKGWSVLVRGTSELVADADVATVERRLAQPWIEAPVEGRWVRIRPFDVTGRRLV